MKKILSTRVLVKICVLTTILLVLIIYTIWGNSALMVSMVNISSDRIASAFSNFRIAQVSDLHNAEFGESNTELIELLSEHEPDIIVITGDLIDAGHTDIEIAFDFVKKAVQIAPVYFVTGNHEANFSHYDQFLTILSPYCTYPWVNSNSILIKCQQSIYNLSIFVILYIITNCIIVKMTINLGFAGGEVSYG